MHPEQVNSEDHAVRADAQEKRKAISDVVDAVTDATTVTATDTPESTFTKGLAIGVTLSVSDGPSPVGRNWRRSCWSFCYNFGRNISQ